MKSPYSDETTCCEAKGPLLSSDLFECSPIQCQVITVILPITTIAVFYLRNVLICDGMGWKEGDQEYIHHLSKHEIFLQHIFCKKCLLKIPKICKSLILFIFFFGCRDIPCLLKWGTYSCSPCGENHCLHIVCMTIIIYMKFKLSTKKWKLLSKFEKVLNYTSLHIQHMSGLIHLHNHGLDTILVLGGGWCCCWDLVTPLCQQSNGPRIYTGNSTQHICIPILTHLLTGW